MQRRTVLKSSLLAGTAIVFSGSIGGLRAFAASAALQRRSLHDMQENDPDLSAYREFVRIMQAKDQQQALSWLGYSLQHGRYGGGYRYCPHGDWYFLPWHREYVLMYERAVRVITNTPKFAMPYWDWSTDRQFPEWFAKPTYAGKPNPLYVSTRTLNTSNWPLKDTVVGKAVMDSIYRETDFQLFGTSKNPAQDSLDMKWVVAGGGAQGTLERNPHNNIHNWIGGYMPSAGSPRDPIFMMHHSNIDRIWAYWNALGRSNTSGMSTTDQNFWLNMNFKDNYLNPQGQTYSAVVNALQDTVKLGYTYPDLPQPDQRKDDPERTRRLLNLFATRADSKLTSSQVLSDVNKTAARIESPLVKTVRLPKPLRSMALEMPDEHPQAAEVFALIKQMQVGDNVESVRVFVNSSDLSAATPDDDPHFVTTIGFLAHTADEDAGHDHVGHGKAPPSALVDLTATLRRLAELKLLRDDTISVHLLPVLRPGSANDDNASLVPAEVEIAVL